MLVLSRKVGERVLIGDNISITIVRVAQNGVRIGIDAPSDLIVVREELQNGAQEVPSASESAAPSKPR
jgi:carbon storage regulator